MTWWVRETAIVILEYVMKIVALFQDFFIIFLTIIKHWTITTFEIGVPKMLNSLAMWQRSALHLLVFSKKTSDFVIEKVFFNS